METRPLDKDSKGEAGITAGTMETATESADCSTHQVQTNPLPSPEIRPLTRTNSVGSTHSRSASLHSSARQRNRLSLSFPVNPSGVTSPRYVASSTASPLSPPTTSTAATPVNIDPNDSSSFLTALAAQERRVLELKEELSKAESELSRMQHLWAVHEGKRKRKEIAMMENLRRSGEFSGASGSNSVNASGDEGARSEEQQLREQIMRRKLAAQKAMNRRSFPGQKHTRTLSLLSPQFNKDMASFEQPSTPQEQSSPAPSDLPSARSSTSDNRPSRVLSFTDFPLAPKATAAAGQEVILRAGKQIADDFKEGLWTFIEDLRQATVGDEAASDSHSSLSTSPNLRRQSSKSSIRSHSSRSSRSADSRDGGRMISHDGDFMSWQEPKKARVPHSRKDSETVKELEEEDESNRAHPRWSTSTTFSEAPSLVSSHSRQSTRSSISSAPDMIEQTSSGNGFNAWGFNLTNVRKTATSILNTVEKTLAPPLPEEYQTEREIRRKPSIGRMSS